MARYLCLHGNHGGSYRNCLRLHFRRVYLGISAVCVKARYLEARQNSLFGLRYQFSRSWSTITKIILIRLKGGSRSCPSVAQWRDWVEIQSSGLSSLQREVRSSSPVSWVPSPANHRGYATYFRGTKHSSLTNWGGTQFSAIGTSLGRPRRSNGINSRTFSHRRSSN